MLADRYSAKLPTTPPLRASLQSSREKKFPDLEHLLTIPHERGEKGFFLVLDEIEDPQNLGALVRTAECAGVHGVMIPKHHSASVTSAEVKASAGATEHVA